MTGRASHSARSAEETPAAIGVELYAAATSDFVKLSDALGCERLLRARRLHRLDLNLIAAARRAAIDFVQRAAMRYGARLKACRAALGLLEAAIGAETADAQRDGIAAARDALAAALSPDFRGDTP